MTLWLTHEVRGRMLELAKAYGALETGGVLVGWHHADDWIVTGLIGPGPRAMHGRMAFVPDHRWQVRELEAAYKMSGGDLNYLGDWHSHPTGPARMSDEDRRTLKRINRRVERPLMVIVDPTGSEAEIGAWTSKRTGWLGHQIYPVPHRTFQNQSAWPVWPKAGPTEA